MLWLDQDQVRHGKRFVKRLLSTTVLHPFRHSFLHWRIGWRTSKTSLLEDGAAALASFQWMESPRGHFYADPMLIEHEGRTWLFVEDYRYDINEARGILAAEVTAGGLAGPFRPALTSTRHISYPLIFRHEHDVYMLPETAARRRVELYRAVRFPFEWRFERLVFPHAGYDTTPFYLDGTWYFFTTVPEGGTGRGVTYLLWSDSLTGSWRLHPAGPLGDPGEGRGAGPIFQQGGRWIRPTQCGRPIYGYSFSFDEITHLDRETFSQRRLATFEPTWHRHIRGMHTYGRAGEIEVIDGCWGVNPYDVI